VVEGVFFKKIKSLEKLIRTNQTGSPEELAEKLNISVTLLYYCLQSMKEMNVPVAYSKAEKTFYFQEPGYINEHFLWKSGLQIPDYATTEELNTEKT
jgi:predicted transcriptional regulator